MSRIRVQEVPPQLVAVVRGPVPLAGPPAILGTSVATIEAAVRGAGGVVAGPAFAWYHRVDDDSTEVSEVSEASPESADPAGSVVSVGVAVSGVSVGDDLGGVDVVRRPGGLAAVARHIGPYDTLADTHRELESWLNDRQLDPSEEFWEEFVSDPEADEDPLTWETRLVRPLR